MRSWLTVNRVGNNGYGEEKGAINNRPQNRTWMRSILVVGQSALTGPIILSGLICHNYRLDASRAHDDEYPLVDILYSWIANPQDMLTKCQKDLFHDDNHLHEVKSCEINKYSAAEDVTVTYEDWVVLKSQEYE
jgi:hypothetical protein